MEIYTYIYGLSAFLNDYIYIYIYRKQYDLPVVISVMHSLSPFCREVDLIIRLVDVHVLSLNDEYHN